MSTDRTQGTDAEIHDLLAESLKEAAIIILDEGGAVLHWNAIAEKIHGYSADEMLGRPIANLYPSGEAQSSQPAKELQSAAAEGRFVGEGWSVRKDGSRFWANRLITRLRGEEGRSRGFSFFTSDFTARRRAEEEHARQAALIDLSPGAIIARRMDGVITLWSRGAEATYGWTKAEVLDRVTHSLFQTRFPAPLEQIMDEFTRTKRWTGELVHRTKDGREIVVQSWWQAEVDARGEIVGMLESNVDITQRKQDESKLIEQEAELRARNEELAASEEAKIQLIERLRYSVAELSNPILEVWDDVLAMPIIGVVDSKRTADMVHRLLAEVARTQANFVIVDLTGVEIVDTKTADHLTKLIRKVELVGARCVLTGIRPAVAETLVDIGLDFGRLTTLRNLKHGLREALRFARRERDGTREIDLDSEPHHDTQPKRRSHRERVE
jgi:PAS domain S-box-containing protein